ncbi:helix-turn-helix transcriptional regulator [Clostridium tyrobutyricum]|uniref:helix-turn-helix domain-containing protein n=1 Tax=Clostridium tyrobutyricum TaxID=1519 RepID=UPI001C389EBF|nr:helix-turn-helix transcriptional regulator [Clostridium tyrobutyricum]MBV4430719.1 helix-turn-helix transcriptional regulator [Clostridium tyrobutyricum]
MFYRDKIIKLLEEKGWSKYKLAKEASIPQSSLHDILSGKIKNPTVDRVKAIADALEITVDELLDENEDKNKEDFKPTLSVKEQEKLDKQAEELVNELTLSLSQNKDHLSDRDYEVLRASMKGALQAMTLRNKEKYTPKKYRNKK